MNGIYKQTVFFSFASKLLAAMLIFVLSVSFVSQFHYHDLSGAIHCCLIDKSEECYHVDFDHCGGCSHSHDAHDNCAFLQGSFYIKDNNDNYCSAHHQYSGCHCCAIVEAEYIDLQPYYNETQQIVICYMSSLNSAYGIQNHLRAPPVG